MSHYRTLRLWNLVAGMFFAVAFAGIAAAIFRSHSDTSRWIAILLLASYGLAVVVPLGTFFALKETASSRLRRFTIIGNGSLIGYWALAVLGAIDGRESLPKVIMLVIIGALLIAWPALTNIRALRSLRAAKAIEMSANG